ncbi:hypothetical protein P9112_003415 [Eukaryota sp. TZLM1-RC]
MSQLHGSYVTEQKDDGKIQCLTCAHRCVFSKEGQIGRCNARAMVEGQVRSLVYGKSIAASMDPIEKKPLFHVLPGTSILSVGTVGCNLKCKFCQNYQISQVSDLARRVVDTKDFEAMGDDLQPTQIVGRAQASRCPSIAFTYTEPVIMFEYMFDTFKLAKEKGIKTVGVTNGYWTDEALDMIAPYCDAFNVDLKGDDDFYKKLCGARLGPVQEFIRKAFERGIHVEVTNLVIEGHNDSDQQFKDLCSFVVSVSPSIPLHFSACYPTYKLLDIPRTSVQTLERAARIAKDCGVLHVYLGNVPDHELMNTYCPSCNAVVITRNRSRRVNVLLDDGKCRDCGTSIYGIWK